MEFGSGRWNGQWIWADRTAHVAEDDILTQRLDPDYYDRRVLFRRTFELDLVPETAPLRITADSRYILFLNGIELSRGPIRHGRRQLHFDLLDAADVLRPGRNVIAVQARFFGTRNAWWVPAPVTKNLGGGALVMELDLGDRQITTDEQWRYLEPEAWTPGRPATSVSPQMTETFDARKLDPEWCGPEFDDRSWSPVRILVERGHGTADDARPPSEPYGALLPSPIPAMSENIVTAKSVAKSPASAADGPVATVLAQALQGAELQSAGVLPLRIDLSKGPQLIVADFGKVVAGHPRLELQGPDGARISAALSERPDPHELAHGGAFRYTTRKGSNTFVREDPCGGRYLIALIEGSGYVQLGSVAMLERLRPRPEGPEFACSDPDLDRIYRLGVRTVDLTAQDAYLDCPSREQRAWTGDSVVHQAVDLVTNPDWSLARWNPQLLAQPRADGLLPMCGVGDFGDEDYVAIPDWALHWIRSVHNLYRYTGDRELVRGLLAAAESSLRWFLPFQGADGLVHDVTGWVLIDWSPVPVTGTSASLNALLARGLRDFAEMAEWLGDAGRAAWARSVHAEIAAGFETFWDEGRGAYREQILDGSVQPTVTEHAQASAVCAGIVPADRLPVLRELLLSRDAMWTRAMFLPDPEDERTPGALPSPSRSRHDPESTVVGAQPFFRYVVHDALALLGAEDEIAGLTRQWLAMAETGPTAWREVWEGGSYAHGWSSTPTRDLIVYTMGITPGGPGYATVRVAPRLGDLDWARAVVPTPHGPVTVEVRGKEVTVDSPVPVDLVDREGNATRHGAGETTATI
ncbi:MAG TPA: alpha-L-rhamnosidase C-terminal domain-containing protein [Mycobacteriales bacterium]|nr:alpha-L-rhamnosidase C-terminal domain-containing protein [Mycobacteriales bacterium]